jgi:hypothetical protein
LGLIHKYYSLLPATVTCDACQHVSRLELELVVRDTRYTNVYCVGIMLSVLVVSLPLLQWFGGGLRLEGKIHWKSCIILHIVRRTNLTCFCRKYTGPRTNDIIREIPTEDNDDNDSEESDDITV